MHVIICTVYNFQSLAVLMLHYCSGLQHCLDQIEDSKSPPPASTEGEGDQPNTTMDELDCSIDSSVVSANDQQQQQQQEQLLLDHENAVNANDIAELAARASLFCD